MKTDKIKEIPLVSVIVPSYNHERYITQCIESIIYQTYKNFELIVIDDGSTDNSRAILSELQSRYDFNLIFQQNTGISATLTNAIREIAKGKYICMCSSDDYFVETKIEKQIYYLEKNPQFPACFTKTYHIDDNSSILDYPYLIQAEGKYRSGDLFADILLVNITLPVTFMYKKELIQEIGYFSSKVYCEDYSMALKIAIKYPIGFIDEYLYHYRVQENNSAKAKRIINSQKEIIELYSTHLLYLKAKKNWEIRRINELSRYSEFKIECLFSLFTISFFRDIRYWKSWIRLFISWKK